VGTWPGTAVGAVALSVGVLSEAAFISIRLRQVVAKHLQHDDLEHAPLRGRAFLAFYLPLMAMPLVTLVIQPLGTAAIARMPAVIDSLAVWPVVMGLLFVLQSVGLAFNEVVVALLDRPGARRGLWRFTLLITIATSAILVLIVATPLSGFVFSKVVGLTPELTVMATAAVALALPIPGTRALQSWYQGVLVNLRRTTAITEAVVAFALVCLLVMGIGVARHELPGLYMAILAYSAGRIVQTFWLAWRCHHAMRQGAT
jgi:hypothetical protein